MGEEVGRSYGSRITDLARGNIFEFSYGMGRMIGPAIVYAVLAFLGVPALIASAVIGRIMAILRPLLQRFPRLLAASEKIALRLAAPKARTSGGTHESKVENIGKPITRHEQLEGIDPDTMAAGETGVLDLDVGPLQASIPQISGHPISRELTLTDLSPAEFLEPTAHPDVGDIKIPRKPSGFESGRYSKGRRVRSGTFEELEPTASSPTGRPRQREVTQEEQLHGIPSEEQWRRVRASTPSTQIQVRVQKELPIGSPDPALPGQIVSGPAQADHIVPVDQIRKMPGFANLNGDRQIQVLNMDENFVAMSSTANQSRGAKSFSEWVRHEELGIDVDKAFREKMITRENELKKAIMERIAQLLSDQLQE